MSDFANFAKICVGSFFGKGIVQKTGFLAPTFLTTHLGLIAILAIVKKLIRFIEL